MADLWDYIKSINKKGELVIDGDEKHNYNKFIANKNFSLYPDTIFYSNEMNKYNQTTDQMNFDFYYYGIPAKSRWTPWPKKNVSEDLTIIGKYYNIGKRDAECVLKNIDKKKLEQLRKQYAFIKDNEV